LLGLYRHLQRKIEVLDRGVAEVAEQRPLSRLLMTHPGVGPITALATEVYVGDARRFPDGKALSSYVGMIPAENSSGEKRRLGALTKQGNALLRYLWREAAGQAVPQDEELKRFYRRKLAQKAWGKQKWRLVASWEFGSGSCCVTRWSTTSSAVADGSAGKPMRRGLPINMVRHTL